MSPPSDKSSSSALFSRAQELRDKIQFGSSGQCSKGIEKSIELQNNLKKEVDDLLAKCDEDSKALSEGDKKKYKESLESLKSASAKKLHCLNVLLSVGTLEQPCWNLSSLIDTTAVKLVKDKKENVCATSGSQLPGFIGQLSQNCIFGLTDEWNTISTMARCLQVHLTNASEYHQFYHEIEESEKWMNSDLEDTVSNFENLCISDPTDETLGYFLNEFQAVHRTLSQWKCKLDRLLKMSSSLVPVDLRTKQNATAIPAIALATFYHDNVKMREKEDILVLEGGANDQWKISNGRGDEGYVPALFVLVPGPDKNAVQALDKLRFILLAYWTSILKNYGAKFIKLLLKIFKAQYNNDEDTLKKFWSQHDGFATMEERFGVMRLLLEGDSDLGQTAGATNRKIDTLINGTPVFGDVANIYKELSKDWELYKTGLDVYNYPELMLLLENWQQLQYIPLDQVTRLWLTTLKVDDVKFSDSDYSIDGEKIDDSVKLDVVKSTASSRHEDELDNLLLMFATEAGALEQTVKQVELLEPEVIACTKQQTTSLAADAAQLIKRPKLPTSGLGDNQRTADFGAETTKYSADTEQVTSAHVEERQTFTIRSVVNPANGQEISLDDAIYKGIIVPASGVYRDTKKGEDIPIQVAMSQGLIKVTFSSRKIEKEQKSSVGILTIKSLKETTRPYSIQLARDTSAGKDLNLAEALEKKIIDLERSTFFDTACKKTISLNEAINKKLLAVQYLEEAKEPEQIIKRYAVRAVVDRKNKKTVPFDEAVRQGLIDKDNGYFYDNVTNEKIYVGDALVKGFLKAKQVTESEAMDLNIDPTNQILVDRTKIIKKRLLQPLAALGAFKKLGSSK
ncbi:hypothetical protein HELRODRAFT_192313 [Helobdella robusta]|uniref:Desmoplakin SH3 domain-containing protein n=1 Tax=Helobdella robusta TaxID=6412 RepID=T1FTT7_HELRO|nr:hypothetical protein HELRODRAFT_192313 [Helobdella robusta]ESO01367.1 hypothetical protein HELRODRAFT_192313 [Helobdella robusta]